MSRLKVGSKLNLRRLWQARRAFKQYGLGSLVDDLELEGRAKWLGRCLLGRAGTHEHPRGVRLRLALESLGPVFIKLGQALSTRPDLIPEDIAQELVKLQDEVPAFDSDQAMALISEAFGQQLDAVFAHINPEPLASASVAQVHAATLNQGLALTGQDGKAQHEVVIKVIRPDAEAIVRRDLQVMHWLAQLLERVWSRASQYRPKAIIEEYENTILGELDLRVEAANGARMGANFEESDLIYVPRIYWDYTNRSVLVMERIFGTPMRDMAALKANGVDLERLAADGVNVFFKQAFEDNFFHADMHPGNIFVSAEGRWIAIDFGIMGTLSNTDKHYLAEILLGFFNRDYRRITRAHFRSGWIPQNTDPDQFELAIRLVCEPIFAKPFAEISFGRVLMELFQTVQRFEMPVQPQLVLLYKTLLNIEGLGRQLYPQLNLWDTAKPYLEQWMQDQLSPQALVNDMIEHWPAIRQRVLTSLSEVSEPESEPKIKRASQVVPLLFGWVGLGVLVLSALQETMQPEWLTLGGVSVVIGLLTLSRR